MVWGQKHRFLILMIFLLAGGFWAAFIHQEIKWDLANYHYYNAWAFLNGRTFTDVAPASIHSYFNPLIDLPLYGLIRLFNDKPFVIYFYQGLWTGALWFLIFNISVLFFTVFKPQNSCEFLSQKGAILAAFMLSICGYGLVRQIGTSTNEIMLAVLFLIAFRLLFNHIFNLHRYHVYVWLGAGLILGVASGLKLTVIPMCAALFMTLVLFYKSIQHPLKSLSMMILGGLAGFLCVNGWWMLILYHYYQNPFFPLFNGIFKSPYIDPINILDTRYMPVSMIGYFFYPLTWMNVNVNVTDTAFAGLQMALIFMCILTALCVILVRRHEIIHHQKPFVFVFCFWITAYVFWLLSSSILRYAIVLETLGALVVVGVIGLLIKSSFFKKILYAMIIIYALITPMTYYDWPQKSDSSLFIQAEKIKIPHDAVVLFVGTPITFTGAFLDTRAPYIGMRQETFAGTDINDQGLFKQRRNDLLNKPGQKIVIVTLLETMYNSISAFEGIQCRYLYNNMYNQGIGICPPPDENGVSRGINRSELHF